MDLLSMVIWSWNVAGWMRTTALIKKHFGSVEKYLQEHKVDVLCLQEVKISKKRMGEAKPEESRNVLMSHPAAAYQGYWSSCSKERTTGSCSILPAK